MAFPRRTITVSPPEYPDLTFDLHVNPTGNEIEALLSIDPAILGQALVTAYGGITTTKYETVFDFSTPEAAYTTILDPALPADLRYWLRNAPLDVVDYVREDTVKKFKTSLAASFGSTS